jgi:phosphoribosylformimino-5-aminoimidazole carboxamide ribotide isomerase
MQLYPAIDIRNGKCVRLLQGDKDRETIYSADPVSIAKRWQSQGATFLHIVDLDGAFTGHSLNEASITGILQNIHIPVQLGGGIRTIGDINRWLSLGVARVIIGTAAVQNPDMVHQAINRWDSDHIMVGIDARDGEVVVKGWETGSACTVDEVALSMKDAGVTRIVFTDIARDGMMTGPNIASTSALARSSGLQIIASGGVSSMNDLTSIEAISSEGIDGAIIGKALYEGVIDLSEAVTIFQT